jgi:multiple antibiotic resistance protein
MIFGDSKPQQEEQLEIEAGMDCAVFPLAMPSIASPGAMLAVVVLTENNRYDFYSQMVTASAMIIVISALHREKTSRSMPQRQLL